jgi:phosphate transport system permease protein
VLRTASAGIVTSVMLAFARIAGESAPLMFTAFGNEFWSMNPGQPVASLPLQIYKYAIQPYEQAHAQAWTAALVLISMIVVTVTLFRFIVGRYAIKGVS